MTIFLALPGFLVYICMSKGNDKPTKKGKEMKAYAVNTEIYYTGDMANVDGFGVVTSINPPDKWYGETMNITMEDGREWKRVHMASFSGIGRRFWTAKEWDENRKAGIKRMMEAMAH
jgi:hypothetical protein